MGYAILKGEGSIREKIRELFTSRTHRRRRVVLGPLALASSDRLPWLLAQGITATGPSGALSSGFFQPPAEPTPGPAPEAVALPATPESLQRAAALESWHNFLAEETREPEGLLCFYDRPRSQRVEYCCRFFLGLSMVIGN